MPHDFRVTTLACHPAQELSVNGLDHRAGLDIRIAVTTGHGTVPHSWSTPAATGVAITIGIEWLSTDVWHRWEYTPTMPTLPVLGTGALPLAQWILLPPVLLWMVRRQMIGSRVSGTLT